MIHRYIENLDKSELRPQPPVANWRSAANRIKGAPEVGEPIRVNLDGTFEKGIGIVLGYDDNGWLLYEHPTDVERFDALPPERVRHVEVVKREPVIGYSNLARASVLVYTDIAWSNSSVRWVDGFSWRCGGCREGRSIPDVLAGKAKDEALEHAEQCRAIELLGVSTEGS